MTETIRTAAAAAARNRRERRMVRHWQIRTPKKAQPQTSECRCGRVFAALKTRDAIKARKAHELATGHGR